MTPTQINFRNARKLDDSAIAALAMAIVATLPTGVQSMRGLQKLIRCYMGQKITEVSINTDFKWQVEHVRACRVRVKEFLDEVRQSMKSVVSTAQTKYKICSECAKELPVGNFHMNNAEKDRLNRKCKECNIQSKLGCIEKSYITG